MPKPIRAAELVYREHLTDTLGIFRFELEDGVPEFLAGQFLTIGHPIAAEGGKVAWRAYSIASPPSERRFVELYIRRPIAPWPGKLTTALWDLPVGGTIQHRGITGAFTMEERRPDGQPDLRTLLLVAGGTGIAPFIAYVLEMRRQRTPREVVLLHGVSHAEELTYRALIEEVQDETRLAPAGQYRVRYLPTISRPHEPRNAGWTGDTGRVETLLLPTADGAPSRVESFLGTPIVPEAFFCHVCGYDGTVKAASAVLQPRDFRTLRNRRPDGSFDMKVESYG